MNKAAILKSYSDQIDFLEAKLQAAESWRSGLKARIKKEITLDPNYIPTQEQLLTLTPDQRIFVKTIDDVLALFEPQVGGDPSDNKKVLQNLIDREKLKLEAELQAGEKLGLRKLIHDCKFDKAGICYALACFDESRECKAKNKDGSINYAETEDCIDKPAPLEPPKMVSKCCGTDIEDMTANGYSGVYQCVNCGEMPCDLVPKPKEEV